VPSAPSPVFSATSSQLVVSFSIRVPSHEYLDFAVPSWKIRRNGR
jgi:hypothetical protein